MGMYVLQSSLQASWTRKVSSGNLRKIYRLSHKISIVSTVDCAWPIFNVRSHQKMMRRKGTPWTRWHTMTKRCFHFKPRGSKYGWFYMEDFKTQTVFVIRVPVHALYSVRIQCIWQPFGIFLYRTYLSVVQRYGNADFLRHAVGWVTMRRPLGRCWCCWRWS